MYSFFFLFRVKSNDMYVVYLLYLFLLIRILRNTSKLQNWPIVWLFKICYEYLFGLNDNVKNQKRIDISFNTVKCKLV